MFYLTFIIPQMANARCAEKLRGGTVPTAAASAQAAEHFSGVQSRPSTTRSFPAVKERNAISI